MDDPILYWLHTLQHIAHVLLMLAGARMLWFLGYLMEALMDRWSRESWVPERAGSPRFRSPGDYQS